MGKNILIVAQLWHGPTKSHDGYSIFWLIVTRINRNRMLDSRIPARTDDLGVNVVFDDAIHLHMKGASHTWCAVFLTDGFWLNSKQCTRKHARLLCTQHLTLMQILRDRRELVFKIRTHRECVIKRDASTKSILGNTEYHCWV